ncbi:hypothetical protein ACFYUY_39370 [Kitasatospora sp. NPDC004745]|uniref:hypothetical protein n=1 Tax=Kitasatospora sp. NPDC004745 TaxID=3364019 RepID=UPI0036BEAB81
MSTPAHAAGDAPRTAGAGRRLLTRRRTAAAPPPAALHRVGPHFVIAPGGADGDAPTALPGALTDALQLLSPVARTVTVLAAAPDAPAVLFGRLDELTRTAAARDATALVLAASGLAAAPDTGRRPAERIAELAGLGVVAPDGLVTLRPDGTLLTSGPSDDTPSSWWLCTPAGHLRRLGPLWPLPPEPAAPPARSAPVPPAADPARPAAAPPAAAMPGPDLPEAPDGPHPADPLVTALPHGYWIRTRPAPDGPPGPLTRARADEGTVVLVVGHPGTPLPPAEELADRLGALLPGGPGGEPPELLLSAPWATVSALTALADGLATALGRDLRAAVGLPLRTAAGSSSRVLAADGTPAWEPWLTELTASPARGRVVASAWRTAPGGPPSCGPALYRTPVPGWLLEAVPAGLWLRPRAEPQDRGPRLREPDRARPLLIAGADGLPVPPEVLGVLEDLRAALTAPGATAPDLLVQGVSARGAAGEPAAAVPPPAVLSAGPPTGASGAAAEPEATRAPEASQVPEAAEEPREPTAPAEPPFAPAPAPSPARLLAPDGGTVSGRPSTAAERAAFRALVGEHFQRSASRAEQAATRLPALRSHTRDDLKSDLAAVYLHHVDTGVPVSRAELVASARRPGGGALAAYLACLGSGLRRLPNHRGAVLLGADAGAEVLRHYTPGALLVEPAPVVGTPAAEVLPGTAVEFLVWSATGRRTSVMAEDGEPEVVFPPGSRFSVLEVLPAAEGCPDRVLLREVGPGGPAESADERDRQARTRLRDWLERRDALAPELRRPPARPGRLHLTPGVAAP